MMGWPGWVALALIVAFMVLGTAWYVRFALRNVRRRRTAFQAELDAASGIDRTGPFDQEVVGPGDPMYAIFKAAMESDEGVAGTVVQTSDGVWRPATIETPDGTVVFRDMSLPLPEDHE